MQKATQINDRQALLVLGMHRSGTSALSGVLARLGAQPPKTLMPPTKDNPRGYWESTELQVAHDRLLRSLGSRWNDWAKFNPEWLNSPAAEDFRASLLSALDREFGDASLLLVKDPRICRFLPIWLRVLSDAKITPKVIIPIRHPSEVAQSLAARDGLVRDQSLLLWLRHVLDAEFASRGCDRAFLRYGDLLADWKQTIGSLAGHLHVTWPDFSRQSEKEIDQFLARDLRHHAADSAQEIAGETELAAWVSQALKVLDGYCDERSDSSGTSGRTHLDGIRQEFDRTSAIFASAVRAQDTRAEGKIAEIKAKLSRTAAQQEETSAKLQEAEQNFSSLRDVLMEQNKQVAELALAQENLAAAEAIRSGFADRHGKLQVMLEQQLDLLQSEMAIITSAHRLALSAANSRIESTEQERKALEHKLKLKQQEAQHAHLLADRDAAGLAMEQMAAKIAELVDALKQHEERMAATAPAQVEAEKPAASQLEAISESLREQLEQRFHEIVVLSQMVEDLERARDKARNESRQLSERLAKCQQENDANAARVQELLASHSWRITSPLRSGMNILRSLLR